MPPGTTTCRAPPSSDCTTICASSQVSRCLREREEDGAPARQELRAVRALARIQLHEISGYRLPRTLARSRPDLAHTGSCRRMPSSRPKRSADAHRTMGAPPLTDTFLRCPSCQKPSHCPSDEKNGITPSRDRGGWELISHTKVQPAIGDVRDA